MYVGHSTDGWRDRLTLGQWTPLIEGKNCSSRTCLSLSNAKDGLKDKMSPRGSINLALLPCSL